MHMKVYFITIISLIVLIFGVSRINQTQKPILCVEVGNTRIKACLLPQSPTLEDLKKTKTVAFPSKPWLKQNIDQLFNASANTPLKPLLDARPSKISLSIFGPIYDRRIHGSGLQHGLF